MEEEQKKSGGSLVQSRAMTALQAKQKKEEEDLKAKIAHEELERQQELVQAEKYQNQIVKAEQDRKLEEKLVAQRAEELKLLQEEEAAKKANAEASENEFLQAQASQETRAAQAKKAAAQANLARLKRSHELQRRNAEAKMKMLQIQQEAEIE